MSERPSSVAITGAALTSCIGDSIADLSRAYNEQRTGLEKKHPWLREIPAPVGQIAPEWFEQSLEKYPRWKDLSRLQLMTCRLIGDLIEATKLTAQYEPDEIGLSISTTSAGLEHWLAKVTACGKDWSRDRPQDWFDLNDHGGTLAGVILREFPIRGPDFTFSTACSGGALAIARGLEMIRRGDVKACIVGGVDVVSSMTVFGFDALQVMDYDVSRPFSDDRKGMNLAEGGAFFLLEKKPAGKVLAYLAGAGLTTDYFHMTQPEPSGKPMATSMIRALADANWSAEDVDYVQAHGTGTIANDSAERLAIGSVFGPDIRFDSTKHLHGHCLAAAGALETAMTIAVLPTLGRGRALTNSFGFGGHDVSLALSLDGETSMLPATAIPPSRPQYVQQAKAVVGPGLVATTTHPLWRRMTWTGKAILEARARFEAAHKVNLKELAANCRLKVFYGTMFGEMEAGLIVAEGILKPDVVVSPTAFQQSVHNAPIAYLMQVLECDAPTATITSGAGGYDRCMWLASQDLLAGVCDAAIVVSAGEYYIQSTQTGAVAEAEICVLRSDASFVDDDNTWRLESIAWESCSEEVDERLWCSHFNFDDKRESFSRAALCGNGRRMVSSWHRCGNAERVIPAEDLIPHRKPMLFVDELLELRPDGSGRVAAKLQEDSYAFSGGVFQNHWMVEILAQAVGLVFNGTLKRGQGTAPRFGYLLSVDDFSIKQDCALMPGDRLSVDVVMESNLFPLGKYAATAKKGDQFLARATMKFMCDEGSTI